MKNNVNMVKRVIEVTKPMILIQMVEVTSEPPLEPSQEPKTNEELVTTSSSVPDLPSVPETLDPVLEGSDEEEEHPETQAQALRDYQLTRDRARRVPKEHSRYSYSYIVSCTFAVASYVEEKNHCIFLTF
ncbi:hypothetical protein M9H77_06462 [Catharanthus roseus]|uniref:Uncharacterized protein n=1 Tax=Catharanthus roseus TaxID=4058 RepID=A0ACC0BSG2_CATRO|nr:hypothetical protein M9H77_06462 [Catharanthus roseus]